MDELGFACGRPAEEDQVGKHLPMLPQLRRDMHLAGVMNEQGSKEPTFPQRWEALK